MKAAIVSAVLALPVFLAAADPAPAGPSSYTLTIDIGGDPDRDSSEGLLDSFRAMDGVRSARVRPDTHWTIELTVVGTHVITPAQLRSKLASPEALLAVRISVTGRVAHQRETWILCADGSRYCYGVVPTEDLEQAVEDGCTRFRIEGELSDEPRPARFRTGAIIIEAGAVEPDPS